MKQLILSIEMLFHVRNKIHLGHKTFRNCDFGIFKHSNEALEGTSSTYMKNNENRRSTQVNLNFTSPFTERNKDFY